MILLTALLRLSELLPSSRPDDAKPCFSLGDVSVDAKLGGGLVRGALHEIYTALDDDGSCATAFALMLAMRACGTDLPVIWIREDRNIRINGSLHAPGLSELGFDPDRLILISGVDTLCVLRAAADIVKCRAIGAVIVEPSGKAPRFDLTASRRLSLSAGTSGVLTLVVRIGTDPVPSAAHTRWHVASSPAQVLEGEAPGHPSFDVGLLRHRGGIEPFETRLEWKRDECRFAMLQQHQSPERSIRAAAMVPHTIAA